jgi:hypothetical protein
VDKNSSIHPKEYYEYKLRGIVLHSGTAYNGHYYSFINTNGEKWLEFNDSNIKDFDPAQIESECFGGSSGVNNNNSAAGPMNNNNTMNEEFFSKDSEYGKNAYILVYERNTKDPLQIVFDGEKEKAEIA